MGLRNLRNSVRQKYLADEQKCLTDLMLIADLDNATRHRISDRARQLVDDIRNSSEPGLMESLLAEYGLSTDEGIALMCLAEALLRVPDDETMDALIEDKVSPSDWGKHLGHSSSSLVNASTWALMLTGKVLDDDQSDGLLGTLRGAVKRLGEPVIRVAVLQAMKEMGRQFVLGETITDAKSRARVLEDRGYTYSYDMLGEAARTEADAKRYHLAYSNAITQLADACVHSDIRKNPGISVKLSALHPRYEMAQRERVLAELVPRTRSLALLAKSAGMGLNIDAEEADRLDLSLDVIEAVLADPSLKGWNGFGIVVQAFGQRAASVIDWIYGLAEQLDRKVMVRLVKGAYWDTEIKRAQVMGLAGFPVFTRKQSTDVSYIACARKLLNMTDRIYPQFATHNAHSIAAILEMSNDPTAFEFQKLHGMGDQLHNIVLENSKTSCRVYAPVGAHRDLLAYLVRRLLENGANSSFVNQIVDEDIPSSEIATDPLTAVENYLNEPSNPNIALPAQLFGNRTNSQGFDLTDPVALDNLMKKRDSWKTHRWTAKPAVAPNLPEGVHKSQTNPADPDNVVGSVSDMTIGDVAMVLKAAQTWSVSQPERAKVLRKAADLYEQNAYELMALLAREAGKTLLDCEGEIREAVDFLRYYSDQSERHASRQPCGIFGCISPWNFPLAIFTGQIAAALATGNGVVAKPAEQTPLIAYRAIELLHEAGVPKPSLQFAIGPGAEIGSALVSNQMLDGVCFTGSTQTAQSIHRAMAANLSPNAPLIAETGGLNAMIVDSTALPEQAVRDILASAFQSAGQRCSALRVLFVQEDVAHDILDMLSGAMDELIVGDPWRLSTDIGPAIDRAAQEKIRAHIDLASREGRLLKELDRPLSGHFVPPTLLSLDAMADLEEEIFGPVLHVVRFHAQELDGVLEAISASGYGLTFGLHSRIDDRVQKIVDDVSVGNIYVNRNQIGAVVGSQPFGGEGLSGTGPKAGGPLYLERFLKIHPVHSDATRPSVSADTADAGKVQQRLLEKSNRKTKPFDVTDLPGPTGESNRLSHYPRGTVLCLGPSEGDLRLQVEMAHSYSCPTVSVAAVEGSDIGGWLDSEHLTLLTNFDAVAYFGPEDVARDFRKALANRKGTIIPLIRSSEDRVSYTLERHVCVDTTAAGGNTTLLAASADA